MTLFELRHWHHWKLLDEWLGIDRQNSSFPICFIMMFWNLCANKIKMIIKLSLKCWERRRQCSRNSSAQLMTNNPILERVWAEDLFTGCVAVHVNDECNECSHRHAKRNTLPQILFPGWAACYVNDHQCACTVENIYTCTIFAQWCSNATQTYLEFACDAHTIFLHHVLSVSHNCGIWHFVPMQLMWQHRNYSRRIGHTSTKPFLLTTKVY